MINTIIGILSGIISGTGMGGGTLLIYLLMKNGLSQHVAQACNLIFFIPTAIVATSVNVKNKNIDYKLAGIVIVFGILGAIIGSFISIRLDVEKLRIYFGIFLLTISINEIRILKKSCGR